MIMKRDGEARAQENHHFHHCHQQQLYGLYLENPSNLHAVFFFKLVKWGAAQNEENEAKNEAAASLPLPILPVDSLIL